MTVFNNISLSVFTSFSLVKNRAISQTDVMRLLFITIFCLFISLPQLARAQNANSPEYEQNFMRLAEILGSVHHLWSLCHPEDSQKWRDQMMKLLETDATTPARRARLVNKFNTGYKNLKITYKKCDQTTRQAELRFLSEGEALTNKLKRERKSQ